MGPDWLGSPQHVVAGIVVAGLTVLVTRRWIRQWWLLLAMAVGVTAIAEIVVELIEYPVLYDDDAHGTTYYWDTLADLASTLVGSLIGAGAMLLIQRRTSRAS